MESSWRVATPSTPALREKQREPSGWQTKVLYRSPPPMKALMDRATTERGARELAVVVETTDRCWSVGSSLAADSTSTP